MVWTAVQLDVHTDLDSGGGIMTARHRSDILEPIVRPHAGAIGDAFILMQDNACAHTAQVFMTFTDETCIIVMNWQAMSPYINPTEHTWGILSRHVRKRQHHPENVQNLTDAQVQELQATPLKGSRSMTCRCQEYVNDKGGQTSYW